MSIRRFAIVLLIICLGAQSARAGGVLSSGKPQTIEFDGVEYQCVQPVYLRDSDIKDADFVERLRDVRRRVLDLEPCDPRTFAKYADFTVETYGGIRQSVCYKQPIVYYSEDMCKGQKYTTWKDVIAAVEGHLEMLDKERRIVPVAALRVFLGKLQNNALGYKDWIYASYLLVLKLHAFYAEQGPMFFARERLGRRGVEVLSQSDDVLDGFARGPAYRSDRAELVQDFQTTQNILEALFYVLVARIHEKTGCFYEPFSTFLRYAYTRLMPLVYISSPRVSAASSEATKAAAAAVIAVLESQSVVASVETVSAGAGAGFESAEADDKPLSGEALIISSALVGTMST